MGEEIEPLVVPLPRVSVSGTVVAAEDGRPLRGAVVRYRFDPAEEHEGPRIGPRGRDRVRIDRPKEAPLRGIRETMHTPCTLERPEATSEAPSVKGAEMPQVAAG
jgi:hypothetical protein